MQTEHFADHFSTQAETYARYRPNYPPGFFEYLASLTPERSLAWDCATGNGQSAIGLADHFEKVIAPIPAGNRSKMHFHIRGLNIFSEKQNDRALKKTQQISLLFRRHCIGLTLISFILK